MKGPIWMCLLFAVLLHQQSPVAALVRDLCQVVPSTTGLCVPTTVGIYYDPELQRCRYMGCSSKRLFDTLADCDKICNNARHVKRRNRAKANETTH